MTILVDTFAWLEIFKGSELGRKAMGIITSAPSVQTTSLNLYEVHYRTVEIAGENKADNAIQLIKTRAKIIQIDEEIAICASRIRKPLAKRGAGAVDCLTYAAATKNGLKLLTGDPNFKGMANVIFLE